MIEQKLLHEPDPNHRDKRRIGLVDIIPTKPHAPWWIPSGRFSFTKMIILRKCPEKESTAMIKAVYRNMPVEVLVEYKDGKEKYAVIRAIEGKPFHRKDKWLTKTEYTTIKLDELTDITPGPSTEPKKPNLLIMALTHVDKNQWYSGESVWLWRNGNQGAFLKEQDGMFVTLNFTGYQEYLVVFWLNPETWSWEISRNLGSNYYQWIDQYKDDLL